MLYLRTVQDSDRLKAAFQDASRVAIIGGGWIGLETAAAARTAGAAVTVLERGELPLLRVLGREAAEVFADLHREHGVDLRCGVQVAEITGSNGIADGVRLADGSRVEADVIIVGIGITPNSQLAVEAGLETGNGVVVDAQLRSSDPDIYAAGDVATAFHPLLGKHIRVDHWYNALHQPQTAAKAMLGQDVAYDRVPYFYTDQYDLGMEYSGYVEPDGYDEVVFRGDVPRREFIAFWLSRRPGAGRHERQHLGRQRGHPGTDTRWPAGGQGRAPRPGNTAGITRRPLIPKVPHEVMHVPQRCPPATGAVRAGAAATHVCPARQRVDRAGRTGMRQSFRRGSPCR